MMRNIAFWLAVLFVFILPWENVVTLEGIGRISRVFGLVLAFFWLITVASEGEFRKPGAFHIAVCLFAVWNVASVFWTIDVEATHGRIRTYTQMLVFVAVLWDVIRSRNALQMVLQAYVCGGYVCIVGAVTNYRGALEDSTQRYAASGFHPNDMGLILALGLPVAWYLAVFGNYRKELKLFRLANFLYIPAAAGAIFLTASRGTVVAASPTIVFILASLPSLPRTSRLFVISGTAAAMVLVVLMVPASSWARLATIPSTIAEGDMNDRVDVWLEGVDLALARPMLGVGGGAYRTAAVETRHVAHNVFVSVLCELGLVGLLLFGVVLSICFSKAIQHPRWYAWLWVTVLLIWSLGALVHTWEQRKQTWLFFSLVVVSSELFVRTDNPKQPRWILVQAAN